MVDRERAESLLEKADLEARLTHAESQIWGYDDTNQDLLRRVRMLEHALRQERMHATYRLCAC